MIGLMKGEGIILRRKYQRELGISQWEAGQKVTEFVEKLKEIREKETKKGKSEVEIENKIQEEFEKEFQKLCGNSE